MQEKTRLEAGGKDVRFALELHLSLDGLVLVS
jgi:hypothetical protein